MQHMYVNERLYTEVGDFWAHEDGAVFEVTQIYPSIGGSTRIKYGLKHLRTDNVYTWNANEVLGLRLKPCPPEDVELKLLGEW